MAATEILIIGAGNMGGALAKGLSGSGAPRAGSPAGGGFTVTVYDLHTARVEALKERFGVHASTDPAAALPKAQALALCVKPQDLVSVTAPLKGKVPAGCLVISILAGTTLSDVEAALAHKGGVVRAMPNIA